MPIPSSGPLSMSMFNTVVGRDAKATSTKLAGGSTPISPSLFWLANQSGSLNQTPPHAFSEWYNYSPVVTITLYGKLNSGTTSCQFAYSTDGGTNYTLVGATFNNTVCTQRASFTVTVGSNVLIQTVNSATPTTIYRHGSAAGSTCPATGTSCQASLTNVQAATTRAFNVNILATC